ncbi:DUF6032 family protein [Ancylomarina sp. 16SWW S1-10-2]|uniref:DUF6032 family protein n=1 Tax=Ancylomarina sp. 16SWW S1-10-2 TaxID=2499681 RepID=UPI0012AD394E|nr:DUF6032 family protein [Ancylomarina sp. 16SWW S1-10-2]MRT94808.1 hypothetical protein [Ancylomarina sp. 16SWW S1-10-2]
MNISKALFFITKLISIILVIVKISNSIINNYFGVREVMFLLAYVVFYLTTVLYQYKRKLFSVGYLIYFIVCFLSTCYGSYNYIYNKTILAGQLTAKSSGSVYSNDHFLLFFSVFISVSLLIDVYLFLISPLDLKKIKLKIRSPKRSGMNVLWGGIFIFPLWLIGTNFRIISVFFVVYFFTAFFFYKKGTRNYVYYLGLFFSILFLLSVITVRYILLKFVLPLFLVSVIIISIKGDFKVSRIKTILYACFGFVVLLTYGIASELLKLNLSWNGNFSLNDFIKICSNSDLIIQWGNRQFYRIIDIWARLGGNIIDLVDKTDFFYGKTYVKAFAGIFNFEYISLPVISAKFIDANYAQPGLLAEGYANFGFVGAVVNILIVFFISELLLDLFIRKQTIFSLLIYVCCFSQVILDGGTINSIIFLMIFCFLTWIFNIVTIKNKSIYEKA